MCYNKETSIFMYIIGITVSIVLYFTGDKYDKHIALFSFVFVHIQLAEFFMWYDEDCKKGINNIATYFALIILALQLISIVIGAIIFKTTYIPNNILYIILCILMIVILYTIFSNIRTSISKCSKNKKNHPHLIWDINMYDEKHFINAYLYYLIYLIFLFFKDLNKGLIVITILLLLLLHSLYNTTTYIREYESIWCLKSVSLPFIMILYNLIFSK